MFVRDKAEFGWGEAKKAVLSYGWRSLLILDRGRCLLLSESGAEG